MEYKDIYKSLRVQLLPKIEPSRILRILPALPQFARCVLNKSQAEIDAEKDANCINAAFNFHDVVWRHLAYSTNEFLNRVKSDFIQITGPANPLFGDLVVFWSRTGGVWDACKIDVAKINPFDPDFPYGLVFDHVAVRVAPDIVFHKPDPTLVSRYCLELFESVAAPLALIPGFEMTFHRRAGAKF